MKTIEISAYQFSELSEQAKVRALANYQSDCEYAWSYEAIQSLKAFMNAVGVELWDYQIDWLCPSQSKVRYDGTPHGKFIKEDLTGVFSDYPLTKNWNYSKNIEYAVDCFLAEMCNDYEYQLSEENYAEICESNDYWFDENGNLI
jgi:GH25 family lysozyme M1 (1,4-beta-N-acetylmuramidase)